MTLTLGLTFPMMESLRKALKGAKNNLEIKVIILSGEGETFSAGGKIREMDEGKLAFLRMIKKAVYNGLRSDLRGHLDYVSSQLALLTLTEDHRKAVRRFVGNDSGD